MLKYLKCIGIIRILLVHSLVAALLSGCLPEYEEPPLTATGEAGESLWSSSSGSSTSASNCTGSVVVGSIPGSSALEGKNPCTLQGSVDARSLTPAQQLQVSGLQIIKGALTVSSAEQLAYFKALTSVDTLNISNCGSGTLELPARIAVTKEIYITGGAITSLKGFAGVQNLSGELVIDSVNGLTSVNAFSALASADAVRLTKLANLTSVQGFGNLSQLKTLQISQMGKLTALPALPKVKALTMLQLSSNPALTTVQGLSALTNAFSLQLIGMDKVASVSFPALKIVDSLHIEGLVLLNSLQGLGTQLVVLSAVKICNIQMTADQREAWRKQHAPNLQFSPCTNG